MTPRTILRTLGFVAANAALTYVLVLGAGAHAGARAPDRDPGVIEARMITLASPDGRCVITLRAFDDIAGIWIERRTPDGTSTGPMVAITNDPKQGAVLGVYGAGRKHACQGALSAGDGGGSLMLGDRDGDKVEVLDLGRLSRLPAKPE